jgi:hypothetical protein
MPVLKNEKLSQSETYRYLQTRKVNCKNQIYDISISQLRIIIMKYQRQLTYQEKRFSLAHGSGGSSQRFAGPIALGL